MNNQSELEALGGFDRPLNIPTWLALLVLIGAPLLATIGA